MYHRPYSLYVIETGWIQESRDNAPSLSRQQRRKEQKDIFSGGKGAGELFLKKTTKESLSTFALQRIGSSGETEE